MKDGVESVCTRLPCALEAAGFSEAQAGPPPETVSGMLQFDAELIISEGFGNFVAHASLGYHFIVSPTDNHLGLGTVALCGQYSLNPHFAILGEVGLNAAPWQHIARYVTLAIVFYAL